MTANFLERTDELLEQIDSHLFYGEEPSEINANLALGKVTEVYDFLHTVSGFGKLELSWRRAMEKCRSYICSETIRLRFRDLGLELY